MRLVAGLFLVALAIGFVAEPNEDLLRWWWQMVVVWIWLLASLMTWRFIQGKWKTMQMV